MDKVYFIVNGCCKIEVSNCTKDEIVIIVGILTDNDNDVQVKREVF